MDKLRDYLASTAVDDLTQVAKARPDPKQMKAILGAKGTGLATVTETMDGPRWLAQKIAYCLRKMGSITVSSLTQGVCELMKKAHDHPFCL